MPPKKQITKDQIIEKAYKLVRESGFENLTARILANELNCSTQPIYMSFRDMNELKNSLAEKSLGIMLKYIERYSIENYPLVLAKVLGYVQFAKEEKHLYKLIFSSDIMNLEKTAKLVSLNNELELNMLIYAHGIIMMTSFNTLTLQWEQMKKMIIDAYEKFQQ